MPRKKPVCCVYHKVIPVQMGRLCVKGEPDTCLPCLFDTIRAKLLKECDAMITNKVELLEMDTPSDSLH